jgi:S1-C subfamily serine protease
MPRTRLALLLALAGAVPAAAQPPKAAPPAKPWFVDDEKLFDDFMDKLTALAKDGKCLTADKLADRLKKPGRAAVTPAKPGDKPLSPEDVYRTALPSVFVVGTVYKDADGEWQDGLYATAWVAAADGVLVTNWHVFEDLEAGEAFGAVDHKGNVYPVTEFLGGDKVADVAVVRIDAKGLTPLPVSADFAAVGAWVGVLGHPGDNFYVYTTGAVTRYSTNKNDDGKRERWMGLTAEYAGGSSGSPVLDRTGAVVGMAALTLTIDDAGAPPVPGRRPPWRRALRQPPHVAPPPRPKPDPMAPPVGPGVQMVLKMAVPGPTILKSLGK